MRRRFDKKMTQAPDIIAIYNRIQTRLNEGNIAYENVEQIVEKRAAIEDKIVETLKALLPKHQGGLDPLEGYLVEHLNEEIKYHSELAESIRRNIIQPVKVYEKTMKEQMKKLATKLKDQMKVLNSANSSYESAKSDLEAERRKLSQTPPQNQAKQQQKIAKAHEKLNKKLEEVNAATSRAMSSDIPNIQQEFGDFDCRRMKRMQQSAFDYSKMLYQEIDQSRNKTMELGTKINKFDAVDRSKREVALLFDPSAKVEEGPAENMCVAIANFHSNEPSDLNFERGEQIKILQEHSSGWWDGELGNKKGTFPSTYVQRLGKKEVKNDVVMAVFLVIKDSNENEPPKGLQLLAGDLVFVEKMYGERCTGTNLRTNQRGNFLLKNLEIRI